MASVRWSESALRDLDKIDYPIAERIVEKTIWLENNFANIVPEKLRREFTGLYKLRVGDYRIAYSIRGSIITIEIVGNRRDVYK